MLLCLHRFKKLHDLVREPVVAQAVLRAAVRVVVRVVLWAVVRVLVRVVVQRVVVRRVVVVVRLRGYIVCFLKSSGVTVPVLLPIRHERRRKLKTAEIVSYSLSWKPCMARVFRRSNVMRVNSLTRSFIIGTFRTGNCRYSIGHS